ncbi:MAG: citrate lyase holo-[Clostridia bacterium]|nr:citrate lyase holo-[acyl-carrier protein] synthase [Clostridia bacterium]
MGAYIEVTVPDMMQAREARFFMQQAMLARYPGASLVCLTMNVAGPVKTTPEIERAFMWGMENIRAVLAGGKTLFEADIHEKTGPEAVFVFCGDAKEIKRRLCLLEDGQAMGRLLDIDVIQSDGTKIARTEIGLLPRKCLLCGQDAPVCARSRTHTVGELFARTHQIIDEHFADEFGKKAAQQAQRALLYEVAITPKPGLVDRANAGAHTDMDVFTFMDSACALREYFEQCARIGLAHRDKEPAACFDSLRTPGLLAEAAMKRATGGVNTHKGAIFSLGIYCAALGMGYDGSGSDVHAALTRCGEMTRARMEQELSAIAGGEARTFGEEIYKKSRIGGVREEAASGFAAVRDASMPRLHAALEAGLNLNDAGICALAALMARTQDTNAVRRGGEEAAEQLRRDAQAMDERVLAGIQAGTLKDDIREIKETLAQWDGAMSAKRISPGGCADLLALTLLARFME